MRSFRAFRIVMAAGVLAAFWACSSARVAEPVKRIAWVGYAVSFECPKDCPYTLQERSALASQIAKLSFESFDRELRRALAGDRELLRVHDVTGAPEFARELKTDSFKSRVARWFGRLGLSRAPDVIAPAEGLKALNPAEPGWDGASSVASLGKTLGVDGVLVGHITITPTAAEGVKGRLTVTGPKVWLYSSATARTVAITESPEGLRLEAPKTELARLKGAGELSAARELKSTPRLDTRELDKVASRFGSRLAQALAP